jgi:hypothetical protein
MHIGNLLEYACATLEDREIGVTVYSIESGDEVATTFAVTVEISEFGELMLCIDI